MSTLRRCGIWIITLALCISLLGIDSIAVDESTLDINKANFHLLDALSYTGESLTPVLNADYSYQPIYQGIDYTVQYSNNILPGIAVATVTGIGRFRGTRQIQFLIEKRNIADVSLIPFNDVVFEEGAVYTPVPIMTWNGTTLKQNEDYIVHYYQNDQIGTAIVMIIGQGNFCGSIVSTFSIKSGSDPISLNLTYRDETPVSLNVGQILQVTFPSTSSIKLDGINLSVAQTKSFAFDTGGDHSLVWIHTWESGGYQYVGDTVMWVVTQYSESYTLPIHVNGPVDPVDAVDYIGFVPDGFRHMFLLCKINNAFAQYPSLSWSSSNPAVAQIDGYGRVSMKAAGSTDFQAKTSNNKNMTLGFDIDPISIQTKAQILGAERQGVNQYRLTVVCDNEPMLEGIDYSAHITVVEEQLCVTITGCGLFSGSQTKCFPAPVDLELEYPIMVDIRGNGELSLSQDHAKYGETITVTAVPSSDNILQGLLLDGVLLESVQGNHNQFEFTIAGLHTITAVFQTAVGINSLGSVPMGSGTAEDPFRISSGQQLAYVASQVNQNNNVYSLGHYVLENDIDLGDYSWTPIGEGGSQMRVSGSPFYPYGSPAFKGSFDGKGHTIYGLTMNQTLDQDYAGLFGYISGGSVSNLNISDAMIAPTGSTGYYHFEGILAGAAINTSITNCSVSGTVINHFSTQYVSAFGGLVGTYCTHSSSASLTECSADVIILNGSYCGGLAGIISNASISECNASGKITNAKYVGGFCGSFVSGNISRCSSDVSVTGKEDVGGFVGSVYSGTISDCRCSGTIGGKNIGGFVGKISESGGSFIRIVSACSLIGSNDTQAIGAFCGSNLSSTNPLQTGIFVGDYFSTGETVYADFGTTTKTITASSLWVFSHNGERLNYNSGVPANLISSSQRNDATFYSTNLGYDLSSVWSLVNGMLLLRSADLSMVESIEVLTMPRKTIYLPDEDVDPEGLTLMVYSHNGNVEILTGGFRVSLCSNETGEASLEVFAKGKTVSIPVIVAKSGAAAGEIKEISENGIRVSLAADIPCIAMVAVYNLQGKLILLTSWNCGAGYWEELKYLFAEKQELPSEYTSKLFLLHSTTYSPLAG